MSEWPGVSFSGFVRISRPRSGVSGATRWGVRVENRNRYDSEIDRSRRVLVEFSIAKVNSADRTQHNPGVHTTHHIHIAKLRTSFGVTSFRPFRAPDHTAHCPHMIASAG